ncbi:MAG TPA: hypothetical protein VD994_02390 [Prosthecobacter sp.]|nr:hypothetical protein [Prosthecobacter sp.]
MSGNPLPPASARKLLIDLVEALQKDYLWMDRTEPWSCLECIFCQERVEADDSCDHRPECPLGRAKDFLR